MNNGTNSTSASIKNEIHNEMYAFFLSTFHHGSLLISLGLFLSSTHGSAAALGSVKPIKLISSPVAAIHHNALRQPSSSSSVGNAKENSIKPIIFPVEPIPVAMETCFAKNSGIIDMAGEYTSAPLMPIRTPYVRYM